MEKHLLNRGKRSECGREARAGLSCCSGWDRNAGFCSYSQFLERDEKNTCLQFFIRYSQLCPLFIFLT